MIALWVGLALAQEAPDPEEPVRYAWEETGPDYADLTARGLKTGSGGLITGGVGVGLIGVGVALQQTQGACAPVDGVCAGAWAGDGVMLLGVGVAHIGAISLFSGGLRARRGLRGLSEPVTVAPAAAAIPMWLAAAATVPLWVGLAEPSTLSAKLPYLRDGGALGISGSFLVASYGLGLTQHIINKKAANRVSARPSGEPTGWMLVPSVDPRGGRGYAGLVASTTF